MRRLRKIVLWLLGVAIALPALAVAIFFLTPSSIVSDQIAAWSKKRLGRELTIAGPIERRLSPTLGLTAHDARLANAAWAAEDGPLLAAKRASFDVALWPLLSGRLDIVDLTLEEPVLSAEVNAAGAPNWRLGEKPTPPAPRTQRLDPDAPTPSAAAPAPEAAEMDLVEITRRLRLADARLIGGALSYRDRRAGGAPIEIRDLTLTARLPAYDAPLEFHGTGVINGQPATLTGRLADPAAIEAGAEATATLTFEAAGADLRFEGAVADLTRAEAFEAKGAIEAALSADRAETAWLRRMLPAGLAPLGAARLAGDLTASPEGLDFNLSGAADFNGESAAVTAKAFAGRGWARGETLVDVDLAVANRFIDAGYDGVVGLTPEKNLALEGDYRLRAPDVAALSAWAAPGAPAPLMERIDVAGAAKISDDAARVAAEGVIVVNQKELALTAAAEGPRGWRDGALLQTRFDAAIEELFAARWRGDLRFDPEAGPRLEGELAAEAEDLRALRLWAGAAPGERDYGRFALGGRVFADAASLELEQGRIALGEAVTDARFVIGWDGPRPTLSASLTGGPLDATPLLRALGMRAGPAAEEDAVERGAIATSRIETADAAEGWSQEPLTLDGLAWIDGQAALRLNGLIIDGVALGRTRLVSRFVDGRLDVDIEEIQLFEGSVRGAASLAPSGVGVGGRLEAIVSGVETEPFLAAFGKRGWVRGPITLSADLEAAGENLDEIMRALSGAARGSMAGGAVLAIDFADASLDGKLSALGAEQAVAGVTPFDQAGLSATIQNGVMKTRDLSVSGPVVSVEGAGEVDLGARSLDMVITPVRFGELAILGVDRAIGSAFPIAVRGPWRKIQVSLDRSRAAPAAPGFAAPLQQPAPPTPDAPPGGAD